MTPERERPGLFDDYGPLIEPAGAVASISMASDRRVGATDDDRW